MNSYIILIIIFLIIYLLQSHKKNNKNNKIIIIGGGLAGLVCAIIASEKNNNDIILIEKEDKIGGNSIKASSGINGCTTITQKNNKIYDDKNFFKNDIIKSSQYKTKYTDKLINVLVSQSNNAINWLNTHNVILDKITILGGHTKARTHQSKKNLAIGWYIINTLHNIVKNKKNIKIILNAKVTKIIIKNNKIDGLIYNNEKFIKTNKIVISTGGYSFNHDLIRKYNKNIQTIYTTNGKHATGDVINFLKEANFIDMDKIQIHPTGLIDINDQNNKIKFLAPEYLRGNGSILLNKNGERFCDELETRNHIVQQMSLQKSNVFYLIIPESLHLNVDFYVKKKLIYKSNIFDFCKDQNLNIETVSKNINFSNIFYGIVTPVIHYCMGGIQINENAQVINKHGNIINGLYAIGEVTGGLHSNNRLGGNSLLECVVFGMIVGNNI